MSDELRKAAQDLLEAYDGKCFVRTLHPNIEALRAALAKPANAASQVCKGANCTSTKDNYGHSPECITEHDALCSGCGGTGVIKTDWSGCGYRYCPQCHGRCEQAAPQDQHQKNLKVRAYLHPTSDDCVTTDPTAYINPRLLVALSDIRTAALEQVSRDCQWQASLDDKRDATRYRMARFKGTISDEWQESLDHWIALDAALAAMKEKP